MGKCTAAGAARAAARCEDVESDEEKQRRKVEKDTADSAEDGSNGARRRARGDCERNVALAQLLDELGVASREELHRVVLAFLIKGDRTLAILREDDLGNLIRTGLVEQCAICPRLGSERRPTSSQGCCECSGHRRRLPITLGTHDKRGAAGARGDVVGDGGIQRVRTGGGRQGKHPRESGVGRGGCALGEGCPRLEKTIPGVFRFIIGTSAG